MNRPGFARSERLLIGSIALFAVAMRLYCIQFFPSYLGPDGQEYEYIARGIVAWMSGNAPFDVERVWQTAANRGWLYPGFIAGIYGLAGSNPQYVQIVQAVLDSLSCVLVYAIAGHLFGRKTALLSAALTAVYPGFLFFCTFLSQETTTTFLLLLLMWLTMRALVSGNKKWYAAAGTLLGIVTLYRAVFQFYFVPFLILLLCLARSRPSGTRRFVLCSGCFAVVIAVWTSFALISRQPVVIDTSNAWSVYETLRNDGWPSDMFFPPLTPELRYELERQGLDGTTSGIYGLLPPKVYISAALQKIKKDWVGAAGIYIKKWNRIWWYIDTYPDRWRSSRVNVQLFFHRCLIVLALAGLAPAVYASGLSWLLVVTALYGAVVCVPFIGIPRYNIPLMPYVIMLASFGIVLLAGAAKRARVWPGRKFLFSGGLLVGAGFCFFIAQPSLLIRVLPWLKPTGAYLAGITVMNILFFCLGAFFVRFLDTDISRKAGRAVLVCVAIVSVLYTGHVLSSWKWQEWKVPLRDKDQKIRQVIELEQPFDAGDIHRARLLLDLFPSDGRHPGEGLAVKVNGHDMNTYARGLYAPPDRFANKFFGFYKLFFFDTYGFSAEDFRQWYPVELPPALFNNASKIEVELSPASVREEGGIILFGDYTGFHEKEVFEGPCFPVNDYDTSLFKIMPYDGDYRLERITPLASKKTSSRYFNGESWQQVDLSGALGVQSGVYRIRVEIITSDGARLIL